MFKYVNISNVYLGLWCVFNVTFQTRNMLSRPIFAVLTAITIYYIIIAFRKFKFSPYMKGLTILLLMFFVYGVELILSDKIYYIQIVGKQVNNSVYIITIIKSLCPIFPFYVFTRRGLLNEKYLFFWIFIFAITTTLTYFLTFQQMLLASLKGKTEFVNNQGYMFASIIPLLFCVEKKQWIKYALLAYVTIFAFLSMKRGAIILSFGCSLYFLSKQISFSSSKYKIRTIFLTFIILLVGVLLALDLYEKSPLFATRVMATMEGNTSHRDDIYGDLWMYFWTQADYISQIFGGGANFTLSLGENYAHNDWLEILINNGIIGIIIYLIYWKKCYNQWKYSYQDQNIQSALCCAFVFMFVKTFFSMSYAETSTCLAVCIGYCVAKIELIKNELIYENHILS